MTDRMTSLGTKVFEASRDCECHLVDCCNACHANIELRDNILPNTSYLIKRLETAEQTLAFARDCSHDKDILTGKLGCDRISDKVFEYFERWKNGK